MAIDFYCTECGQLLRVDTADAGREAECPQCGGLQRIPGGGGPGETPTGMPAAADPSVPSGRQEATPRLTTANSMAAVIGIATGVYGVLNLLLGGFLLIAGDLFLEAIGQALAQQPNLDADMVAMAGTILEPALLITSIASLLLGVFAAIAGVGLLLRRKWGRLLGIACGISACGLGLVSCLVIGVLTVVHFGYGFFALFVLLQKQQVDEFR